MLWCLPRVARGGEDENILDCRAHRHLPDSFGLLPMTNSSPSPPPRISRSQQPSFDMSIRNTLVAAYRLLSDGHPRRQRFPDTVSSLILALRATSVHFEHDSRTGFSRPHHQTSRQGSGSPGKTNLRPCSLRSPTTCATRLAQLQKAASKTTAVAYAG